MDKRSSQKMKGCTLFVMILTAAALCGELALSGGVQTQGKSTDRMVKAKEGGIVESPSGTASLVIPAGALQNDTRISIREVPTEGDLAVGPSFEIKPDGLKFLQPAALTIRFSAKNIPEGYSAEDLALSGEEAAPRGSAPPTAGAPGTAGQASPSGMGSTSAASPFCGLFFLDTTANVSAGTVSAQVTHLSKYVLWVVSGYKLGDEQQFIHGTKKFFNIILPIRNLQGKATHASGTCNSQGEFVINVRVPLGQEGMAFGEAVGTKFFRVKRSSKGLKEAQSIVEVEIGHNADISKETNSYNMGYSLTLGAWLPGNWMWSLTGRPKHIPVYVRSGRDLPAGPASAYGLSAGMMAVEGLFQQVFSLHPLIKVVDFPMGPEYPKGPTRAYDREHASVLKHIIAFQNCRLVAGRVYGLVISFQALVNGMKAMPGTPAMGGDVMFDALILRMTIKLQ